MKISDEQLQAYIELLECAEPKSDEAMQNIIPLAIGKELQQLREERRCLPCVQTAREFHDHVIATAAEICEATGDQQEYEGLEQSEVYPTALDKVLAEWEVADKCR